MGSPAQLPPKDRVGVEIRQVATTLSTDMQTAALAKARELGFDLNKGRLTLEETLINLSYSRDVLLDAAQRDKLSHLPLKIQYVLYTQVQKIAESLSSLVNGTDAVLYLEEVVDDLLASIWQYNLHNLSEQVLGYQQKMNQLKTQEKTILEVYRRAQRFDETAARLEALLSILDKDRALAEKYVESAKASTSEVEAAIGRNTSRGSQGSPCRQSNRPLPRQRTRPPPERRRQRPRP